MSFSSNVKAELCKDSLSKKSCGGGGGVWRTAVLQHLQQHGNPHHHRKPRLCGETAPAVQKGVRHHVRSGACRTGAGASCSLPSRRRIKSQRSLRPCKCDLKASLTLHVNFGMLEEEAECMAYLRGAFLAGGSVTDPAKRYHLEMTTSHYKVSRETCALLIECGFSPKELSRGGNNILYFKQSDYIEDFLTAIGAQVSAMGVMEAKVEKDLRNGVNRRVNCETANLTKVVDASMGQMAAIRALEEAGELDKLPRKAPRDRAFAPGKPGGNAAGACRNAESTHYQIRHQPPHAKASGAGACIGGINLWALSICMSIRNTAFLTARAASRKLWQESRSWGRTPIAITDHGVMYGAIDFYQRGKGGRRQAHHRLRGLCRAAHPL